MPRTFWSFFTQPRSRNLFCSPGYPLPWDLSISTLVTKPSYVDVLSVNTLLSCGKDYRKVFWCHMLKIRYCRTGYNPLSLSCVKAKHSWLPQTSFKGVSVWIWFLFMEAHVRVIWLRHLSSYWSPRILLIHPARPVSNFLLHRPTYIPPEGGTSPEEDNLLYQDCLWSGNTQLCTPLLDAPNKLLFVWNRISLCSPWHPGICYVDQAAILYTRITDRRLER